MPASWMTAYRRLGCGPVYSWSIIILLQNLLDHMGPGKILGAGGGEVFIPTLSELSFSFGYFAPFSFLDAFCVPENQGAK